jgi:hypothetical protein
MELEMEMELGFKPKPAAFAQNLVWKRGFSYTGKNFFAISQMKTHDRIRMGRNS